MSRIVYIDCNAEGEPHSDDEGCIYGSFSATWPDGVYVRAYVPAADLDAANARIGELEASVLIDGATLAEQHKRIAELERAYAHLLDELAPTLDAARAEVPAWCHDFMARIARSWDDDIVDEAAEVVHQYADQLRACGIEPTT